MITTELNQIMVIAKEVVSEKAQRLPNRQDQSHQLDHQATQRCVRMGMHHRQISGSNLLRRLEVEMHRYTVHIHTHFNTCFECLPTNLESKADC